MKRFSLLEILMIACCLIWVMGVSALCGFTFIESLENLAIIFGILGVYVLILLLVGFMVKKRIL